MNRDFLKGLRHGVPIALGYLSVSFTFGMKCVADGLTIFQAVAISMLNVTSAGQFAGLPLMLTAAPLVEMALTQLVINLRYALMSLSLSQRLDETMTTPRRLIAAFCNTDEIFAVASSQPGKVGHIYKKYLSNQETEQVFTMKYSSASGGSFTLGIALGIILIALSLLVNMVLSLMQGRLSR